MRHIRLVHFSLIVTSLALILGALSSISDRLENAGDDIEAIIRLSSSHLYQTWLADFIENSLEPTEPATLAYTGSEAAPDAVGVPFEHDGKTYVAVVRVPQLFNITLVGPRSFSSRTRPSAAPIERTLIPFWEPPIYERVHLKTPETIGDFKLLWNDLNERYAYIPRELMQVAEIAMMTTGPTEDGSPTMQFVTPIYTREELPNDASKLGPHDGHWAVLGDESWRRIYHSSTAQSEIFQHFQRTLDHPFKATHALEVHLKLEENYRATILIPLLTEPVFVPAQEYLASKAQQNWPVGDFNVSFPELSQYVSGVESVKLEEVRQLLENARERAGGDVEIFGLKIPVTILSTWGIVLLGGVASYFVLHLSAFASARHDQQHWKRFPWIGIYTHLAARIAFVISVFLLPVSAAAVLVAPIVVYSTATQLALQLAMSTLILGVCASALRISFKLQRAL